MAYNLSWGSTHPGLLIYLVDLSGSMAYDDNKIKQVSKTIWNVVDNLVAPCQDMGQYRERFKLNVIGYNQYTYDIFSGGVNNAIDWLDATEATQQFIDSQKHKAQGMTHMALAYDKAAEIIQTWIKDQNAKGVPVPAPIVINITDGYPEEVGIDPAKAREKALRSANALKSISVPDGNILLFNFHIGDGEPGITFPNTRPNDVNRAFLYDASSELNDEFVKRAQRASLPASKGSKMMVSNVTDYSMLSRIIVFGSSVSGMTKADGRCEVPIP